MEPFTAFELVAEALILASTSPRRRELLEKAGIRIEVIPAHIDESLRPSETPLEYVKRMAKQKALAVAQVHPGRWVLGADTIVVAPDGRGAGEILGKPESHEDACRMLRRLSGRVHQVTTACDLLKVDPVSKTLSHGKRFHVTSQVAFRSLTDEEIQEYVRTGEPMDKAGAYAIQGGAGKFVRNYSGSWANIVGLPIDEVVAVWTSVQ
jgi:septum formation protein